MRQLPPEGASVAGLLLSARGRGDLRPLVRPFRPAGGRRQDIESPVGQAVPDGFGCLAYALSQNGAIAGPTTSCYN